MNDMHAVGLYGRFALNEIRWPDALYVDSGLQRRPCFNTDGAPI